MTDVTRASHSSLSLHLGEGAYFGCHTYPDRPDCGPILYMHVGDAYLTVSPRRGAVTADDLARARALADAVAVYVADIERLHNDNAASSGSEQSAA